MLQTSLIGLLFGTIGTTLGGIIGITSKRTSNKFISFVLSFASGLMLAIVCFSLIPESMEISNMTITTIGIILGVSVMIICDIIVKNTFTQNKIENNEKQQINNSLIKTGIIISIGIALHNIPEGLAIGSGFDSSPTLGLSLAIAICMHDIPEGISMAIPLKKGGMNKIKIIIYVILSGIATGVGAAIGALVGNISTEIIAISLAFAAGAMLYIVSGELIPEYNELYKGRTSSLGIIIGFILGILFK